MEQSDSNKDKPSTLKSFVNLKTEKIAGYSRINILQDIQKQYKLGNEPKNLMTEIGACWFFHRIFCKLSKLKPVRKGIDEAYEQFGLKHGISLPFYKKRLTESKTDLMIVHYS